MTDTRPSTALVDDRELVERARAGERGAFNDLVERHAPKIFRLARTITKNDQDAEDVLQETFLKAYSKLDTFQGESQFYTWLVRIAVNQSLMRLRKLRNRKTVPLDQEVETGDSQVKREVASEGPTPEERYGREETRRLLEAAVDSLSETYRPVFVLRDIEGLSTEETGQMLGLSISAVKSRLLRARLQLREKLRGQVADYDGQR